jgi:hypothetical protein
MLGNCKIVLKWGILTTSLYSKKLRWWTPPHFALKVVPGDGFGTWTGFKTDYPKAKVQAAFAFHRKTLEARPVSTSV